uniref:Signal peptide peptidase-like 2A n=1 Tax=Panagrolaimus sp. ES5 TaxID=591445 RepID=A0AC34G446_9BILA
TPNKLSWYTNKPNETNICARGSYEHFPNSTVVPIRYVTYDPNATCIHQSPKNLTFIDLQMERLEKKNVDKVLFLVKKGEVVEVAPGIHKYLFAQFFNPELTANKPDAFYIYQEDFLKNLLPMSGDSMLQQNDTELEISFYRPKSWPFDLAEVIILIIALFCIIVGSVWGAKTVDESHLNVMRSSLSEASINAHEDVTAEEGALTDTPLSTAANNPEADTKSQTSQTSQNVTFSQQLIGVAIAVAMIVAILMIAFWFRSLAVMFFNIFVTVAGIFCIAKILTSLYCFENPKVLSLSMLCCNKFATTNSFLGKKFGIFTLFAHIISAAFCLTWLLLRQNPRAFYLLNTINISLCIVAISSAQLRNLRVLVLLLIGMFIYDIFMVFGTKLITSNGCSVMIQVVTGVDCNQKPIGNGYYPVAPLEQKKEEIMPLLFYIPLVSDVMQECYDVNVETEFRHIMLGLGDVIVPGYLIIYCFIVDRLKPSKFVFQKYGVIVVFGYALGLVTTFVALRLMQLAQPALIYLVPFTIIPVVITAWLRGHLREIWYGKFSSNI